MKAYKVMYAQFWDHSFAHTPEESGPLLCEVVGVLWKEDDKAIYLVPWVCGGDISDVNNEVYTILKCAILKKRRLR